MAARAAVSTEPHGALRLQLAGSVLIVPAAGPAVELGGQPAAVLAALALMRERALPRDELAELLWPGELPRSWEPSLRALVSKVRAALEQAGVPSPALTSAFGCYQLHLPDRARVDLEDHEELLERAEEALGLHRWQLAASLAREAAAGLAKPVLPERESPWLDALRRRRAGRLLRALEVSSAAESMIGRHRFAIEAAEEAVRRDPFRESAHRALMAAHMAAGSRGEALRAYEACRELLCEELGVDPAPETEALYLQLLGSEEGRGRAPSAPARASSSPIPLRLPPQLEATGPFVGRREELARILEACEEAEQGSSALVALHGEPGIGKTRLAAEVAQVLMARGWLILYGRCEEDLALPYQPVVEALRAALRFLGPDELAASLGHFAGELRRLMPELGEALPELPETVQGDPETQRFRLFEALRSCVAGLPRAGPVLAILDDLQWASAPTLQLLRYLLGGPMPDRLALIACYREVPPDPPGGLLSFVEALLRQPRALDIGLGGLAPEAVVELVAASRMEDSEAVGRRLASETAGNPFLLAELLRKGLEEWRGKQLPPSVETLFARRLDELGASGQALVKAGAILGEEFEVRLAAEVAAVPVRDDQLYEAIGDAARAGLVRLDRRSGRCRFAHALARAAVLECSTEAEQLRLHRRAAYAIEAGLPYPARTTDLARHFFEVAGFGEAAQAFHWCRAAAEQAMAGLAFAEAAEHLAKAKAALELDGSANEAQRIDLELALGEALHRAGDPRHRQVLLDAARAAKDRGDGASVARAALALNLTRVPSAAGDPDPALVELLEDALAMPQPASLRARLLGVLAAESIWSKSHDERLALAAAAEAAALEDGQPSTISAVAVSTHLATSWPGNLEQRLGAASALAESAREQGDAEALLRAVLFRFDALVEQGRLEEAARLLGEAEQLAVELRQHFAWEVLMRRSGLALLQGDLAQAEALAERASEAGSRAGLPEEALLAVYGAQLVIIRFEQGRLEELSPFFEQVVARQPGWDVWEVAAAFVFACTGDLEESRRRLEALAVRGLDALDRNVAWLGSLCMLACTGDLLGWRPASLGALPAWLEQTMSPFSGRLSWGLALSFGPVDHALGLACEAQGRLADARRHYQAALELTETTGAAPWAQRAKSRLEILAAKAAAVPPSSQAENR